MRVVFILIGLLPWITNKMRRFPSSERPICSLFGLQTRRSLTIFPWAAKIIQARFGEKSEESNLLADLLRLHAEKAEWKAIYVLGSAMTIFGAGHDTITALHTAIITCACQDLKHISHIREEITTANLGDLPKYWEAIKLISAGLHQGSNATVLRGGADHAASCAKIWRFDQQ